MEVRDLQQRMRFLQEQLGPVTRQREYQEKEIQRLNKVGARAQPLPAKCLLCSPASSLSNSKLTLIDPLLPSSWLRQELVSDDDHHIPLGSQERGFGVGL